MEDEKEHLSQWQQNGFFRNPVDIFGEESSKRAGNFKRA